MNKKVLAVDDDLMIVKGLEIILTDAGFEVLTCTRGEEVPQKIKLFEPDIIILDVMLGNMDGRIIARDIKTDEETKEIPIIMISANPTFKKSIKSFGIDHFIAKPFESNQIIDTVKLCISEDPIVDIDPISQVVA